jgi:hypothetical protein
VDDQKKIMNETQAMWLVTISLMVINFVFYKFRIGGESILAIVSDLLPVVCGLFAAGALFRVTFYLKTWELTKVAWLMLAFGFLFWWLGECTYAVIDLMMNTQPGVPSLADAFWFCGIFPILTALILFIVGYHRTGLIIGHWSKYVFICGLISVVQIILMARFFMPIIYDPKYNFMEKLFTLIYPAADLAILLLAFVLVLITSVLGKGLLSKPWKYLVIGFVMLSVGDILYSYANWTGEYGTGSYLDMLWNGGYLFIALSAFYQKDLMERF